MPITLNSFTSTDLCFGNKWEISDRDLLIDIVAEVLVGRARHAQKVLEGLGQLDSAVDYRDQVLLDAIQKLTINGDVDVYHRDGLVFQIFSWVAAHKGAGNSSIIATPHLIRAQKGFDGLQVDINSSNRKVDSIRIFEDKATENPRDTIREKVWPEFKEFYDGKRESELEDQLSTLLLTKAHLVDDIDDAIETLIWKDVGKFRVAITVESSHDSEAGIKRLFKDYDEIVPEDIDFRQAEYIHIDNLRTWMDDFCNEVINLLESRR